MNITEERKTNIIINQQMTCFTDGEAIYQIIGYYGANQRQKIGVTIDKYSELEGIAQGYYEKLVELGAIVLPKTAEQLAAEQSEAMAGLLAIVKDLKTEVEELRNECKNNSANVRHERAEDRAADGGVGDGAGSGGGHSESPASFKRIKK